MQAELLLEFCRGIRRAQVFASPFPHIIVRDIFEPMRFESWRRTLLTGRVWKPLVETGRVSRNYSPHRLLAVDDFSRYVAFLHAPTVYHTFLQKFDVADEDFRSEYLLMRDLPGYALGPHTDSPSKVISALLYLPESESNSGTVFYTPKRESFRCPGGPHYPFELFDVHSVMPYQPNTLVAFLKTDKSFHGVPAATVTRDLLLYDIRKRK